jgi:hypothetical protein
MHSNVLVGKPEGKRPLERPMSRWEGNIKNYNKEVVCKFVDRIHLV